MGYFCPKNSLLQLKHYIQRIYLTLLSIICVEIHQIPYVIFETISHFSRHNSSVFLSSNIKYFQQKQPIKVHIFKLSTVQVKIHQIPYVMFQTKSHFFFKVWIFFQCHERSFFRTFLPKTLYVIDKSSSSKCKFSDLPLLTFTNVIFGTKSQFFFQTLHHSSVS